MQDFVALLRAVNVGGTSKTRSAVLKSAADSIGLQTVRPILQKETLVFHADDEPKALVGNLENAFVDMLGPSILN